MLVVCDCGWSGTIDDAKKTDLGTPYCPQCRYPFDRMYCGQTGLSKKAAIAAELYKTLERLKAPPELLSIVGSWGDSLNDAEVLSALTDWNDFGIDAQQIIAK